MSKRDAFVQAMIDIAVDDSHGYSQYWRWGPDYDCSSMTYEAAYRAGYDISREDPRYTGTIIEDFTRAGFRCDEFDGNLSDLEPGDVLLNTQHHVAVYVGNGQLAEASSDENGSIEGYNSGDNTGWEIHICPVYNYPWTHILTCPSEGGDPTPVPHDGVLHGIDVSSHDGAPFKEHTEWAYGGADFVIVKTTQGTWYENPTFDYAYNRAKGDGKLVGIYHYAANEGAREEAEYFYNHVRGYIGEFLPVLDWESYNNEENWGDTNWCRQFVDRFHELSGVYPAVYVQASALWQCENCADVSPLWVAGYPSWTGDNWDPMPDDMPYGIGAWNDWTIWQYTSDGGTDRNVANISSATWMKLCGNNDYEEDDVRQEDKEDIKRMVVDELVAVLPDLIAQATWWKHFEINGVEHYTFGGGNFGTDQAANAAAIYCEKYLPAILEASGADGKAVAEQVAKAVAAELEKISLNVTVKD